MDPFGTESPHCECKPKPRSDREGWHFSAWLGATVQNRVSDVQAMYAHSCSLSRVRFC